MTEASWTSIWETGLTHHKRKSRSRGGNLGWIRQNPGKQDGDLFPTAIATEKATNTFLGTTELVGNRGLVLGRDHRSRKKDEVPKFLIKNDDTSKDSH